MLQITAAQMSAFRSMRWNYLRDMVAAGLAEFQYNPQRIPGERITSFVQSAISNAHQSGLVTEAGIYDFCVACWYLGIDYVVNAPASRAILSEAESGELDKTEALLDHALTVLANGYENGRSHRFERRDYVWNRQASRDIARQPDPR